MADAAPINQYVPKTQGASEPGARPKMTIPPVSKPKGKGKRPDPMAMAAMMRIMAHVAGKK